MLVLVRLYTFKFDIYRVFQVGAIYFDVQEITLSAIKSMANFSYDLMPMLLFPPTTDSETPVVLGLV